jgi:hypothetical protein
MSKGQLQLCRITYLMWLLTSVLFSHFLLSLTLSHFANLCRSEPNHRGSQPMTEFGFTCIKTAYVGMKPPTLACKPPTLACKPLSAFRAVLPVCPVYTPADSLVNPRPNSHKLQCTHHKTWRAIPSTQINFLKGGILVVTSRNVSTWA